MVSETVILYGIDRGEEFLLNIKCKICNSPKVSVGQIISTDHLIGEWKRQFDIDVSEIFKDIRFLELLECQECHLKFFMPDLYQGTTPIYEALENFDWYYMPVKWEHTAALKNLKPHDKIIEVGCGQGHFLERAQKERDVLAVGIDLNQSAIENAQHKGLPVYCMDIQNAASLWLGQFDAVCSFQVLEHLQDPRDFLLCAISMIKPGGKLLLGIPNADSFLKYQFNILDMPPHHSTRWSAKAISYLPRLFPLSECYIKKEPLAEYHTTQFVEAHLRILRKNCILRRLLHQKIRGWLTLLLTGLKINRLLRGHTLYVSFTRN